MLAMRMGREDEARKVLATAFEPRSTSASQSLRVLKHLEKYETIKTAHSLLRYDPKTDAVLAKFMADELETEYAALASNSTINRPAVLIELFSTTRCSAVDHRHPDLHTIGASTGGWWMASPIAKACVSPFNWGRVVAMS